MSDVRMTYEWMTWIAALAAPPQARSRVRLAPLFLGMTFAACRRTASARWRAIGVGNDIEFHTPNGHEWHIHVRWGYIRLESCGPGLGRQQLWPVEVTVHGTIRRGGLLTRIAARR